MADSLWGTLNKGGSASANRGSHFGLRGYFSFRPLKSSPKPLSLLPVSEILSPTAAPQPKGMSATTSKGSTQPLPSQLSLLSVSTPATPPTRLSRETYEQLLQKHGIDSSSNVYPHSSQASCTFSQYYHARNRASRPADSRLTDEQVTQRLCEAAERAKADIAPMEVDDDRVNTLLAARQAPLQPEEKRRAQEALSSPSDDRIVILKFNIDMTRSKLHCLRPMKWLNDEVINFYMCMLQERDDALRQRDPQRRRSHFFNSFFMTKLREGGSYSYAQVRRWSKKFDAFEQDKIFIPVNLQNTHWALAVVYMQTHEIHYYDSMSGRGASHLADLLRWVGDEHKDKKQTALDVADWKLVSQEADVPQQQNGHDCGMFTLVCADYLSEDLPLRYCQADMDALRVAVAWRILNGSLLYPL